MSADDQREPARPLPPRLDPRAGSAPRSRAGTRVAWATRGLAAVLSLTLLCAGGWGWYLNQVAEASVSRTDAIPSSGNEETLQTGSAMNLLIVGNDSRDDLTPEQLRELNAGKDSGTNTDTMMLVHVPADGSKASFVSFPRDSYVQIPGHGEDKLNAAYAYGMQDAADGATEEQQRGAGARLLVQTISQLTGLRIDHYAEVDLLGFFNLTSVVGGVEVNLCQAVDDRRWSGAFFPAGVQTISGADAVKFVRQRHNIGNTSTDFDRIKRQQVFLAGVLRKMLSDDVLLNPAKQQELVQAAAGSLTLDDDLELMELAGQMQGVQPGNIAFQTVPNTGSLTLPTGASIVQLADTDELHAFFADLSADPVPAPAAPAPAAPAAPVTVAPSSVEVQVLNGSGTKGLAAEAAGQLTTAGFGVAGTGNADSASHRTTEIRFAAGDEALAATLAVVVPGALSTPDADATPGTVQLVLGSDFEEVGQPLTAQPAPAAAATAAPVEEARTAADTSCIY